MCTDKGKGCCKDNAKEVPASADCCQGKDCQEKKEPRCCQHAE
ncbi:MAG: hypothetical protein ACOX2G_12575 [Bacillota bacterium]|jgi:hypothetical protein